MAQATDQVQDQATDQATDQVTDQATDQVTDQVTDQMAGRCHSGTCCQLGSTGTPMHTSIDNHSP
jgi:hypothetical protein